MLYKNYRIEQGEYTKFEFVHEEYDGPEDHRLGYGTSIEDCVQQIDDREFENENDDVVLLNRENFNSFGWLFVIGDRVYGTNSFHSALFFSIRFNTCYLEHATHPNSQYL